MVRGINGFNAVQKSGRLILGGKVRKLPKSKLGMPAKVTTGALGSWAIINTIKEPNMTDRFVMKCSDYDSGDNCNSDYWCGLTYP